MQTYSLRAAAKQLGMSDKCFKGSLLKKGLIYREQGLLKPSKCMLKNNYMRIGLSTYLVGHQSYQHHKILITEKGLNFLWGAAR